MLRTLLILLLAVPVATSGTAATRVASINLCADQLLILLADPGQIASLSNLSRDPTGSYYHIKARDYPINNGLAEQILPLQPNLVIVGEYSAPYTVRLLEQSGLTVETLPIARSVDDMLANVQRVGDWLGQSGRAAQIVAGLRERLQQIQRLQEQEAGVSGPSSAVRRKPTIAVFDPNGYTVGRNTVRGDLLHRAGWHNIAADRGIDDYGRIALETLVLAAPDALITSPLKPGSWSRAQMQVRHPVLSTSGINPLAISIPGRHTLCEGPWLLDVLETLVAQRRQVAQRHIRVGSRQ